MKQLKALLFFLLTVACAFGQRNLSVPFLESQGLSHMFAARAARQGLVFDGTAGATDSIPAFGTSGYTYAVWAKFNSLTSTPSIFDGANAPLLNVTSGGTVQIIERVGGTTVASSAAGAITAGKWYLIAYARGQIYINGLASGSSVSDTTNYTGGVTTIGKSYSGGAYVSGTLSSPLIYNRALSASEVLSLYEEGRPAGADYNSASNTNLATQTVVWTGSGDGAISSATATGFTLTETTGVSYVGHRPGIGNTSTGLAGVAPVGSQWLVTFTATLTSGLAPNVGIRQTNDGTILSNTPTVVAGSNSVVLTTTAAGAWTTAVTFFTNAASQYTISNLSVTRLGLLLAPDPQQLGSGTSWYDVSGNSATITLPGSGVTWALPWSKNIPAGATLTTPNIGAATGTSLNLGSGTLSSGAITVSGTGTSSFAGKLVSSNATGGIGYTTGAGGAVTQATSRTTGVTLNTVTGTITLVSAAGSTSWQTFTLTDSAIGANDVVHVTQQSGTDKYLTAVTHTAAGSCDITFATTGGTTTEQPVFNFAVIKGSAN